MRSRSGTASAYNHPWYAPEIQHLREQTSPVTRYLLSSVQRWPLLYSILAEKDSRRIFYFMSLNFVFMILQTFYGVATGSLGLLSDSIHMLFDCLALAVGLCAAVMSKWPPSTRFPYGLGKMDTLAGFANGIFLMLISVEIVTEAIERLVNGSQMKRIGELLTVSIAGLCVNLVGIMAFDHAHHGHSHGGDSHHHHHGDNMQGIFLHILADTLGSASVVVSTVLIHFYRWPGFDPLASCFIAIMIFVSAIPLVISSARTLLLTIPADTEYSLRETLIGVSSLRGVASYRVPKFWLDDREVVSSACGDHDHGHGHGHGHGHNHGHGHGHDHDHDHHNHDHDVGGRGGQIGLGIDGTGYGLGSDGHGHGHNNHNHNHARQTRGSENESHDSHSHAAHKHAHNETDEKHDHGHGHQQKVLGVIHIIAKQGSDMEDVRGRVTEFLNSRDVDAVVQMEKEGEGRCWCATMH
ncbi:MAG: hypothetical protein M1823_006285 [Watsoniomyces obsoletus]|nr:MAG: hypothetical protein M1823_006285 [Watsoniomyces obsoletus]